jgi:hypothetical protein
MATDVVKEVVVPIRKLDKTTMTVSVKLTREFWLRLWLGTRLLKLAAYVLGCRIEIN